MVSSLRPYGVFAVVGRPHTPLEVVSLGLPPNRRSGAPLPTVGNGPGFRVLANILRTCLRTKTTSMHVELRQLPRWLTLTPLNL
jgi:hypothetical protein